MPVKAKLVVKGHNRIDAAAEELAAYAMFLGEREDICLLCLLKELVKYANEGMESGQLVHGESAPINPPTEGMH